MIDSSPCHSLHLIHTYHSRVDHPLWICFNYDVCCVVWRFGGEWMKDKQGTYHKGPPAWGGRCRHPSATQKGPTSQLKVDADIHATQGEKKFEKK
jgi:hypothetical protein